MSYGKSDHTGGNNPQQPFSSKTILFRKASDPGDRFFKPFSKNPVYPNVSILFVKVVSSVPVSEIRVSRRRGDKERVIVKIKERLHAANIGFGPDG
jgi:hypothetical protein